MLAVIDFRRVRASRCPPPRAKGDPGNAERLGTGPATIKELAKEIAKPIPMERDGKRIVMTLIEREGQCRALSYALHVAVMFMDDGTKKLLRSLFSELAAALEEPVTPPRPHVEAARREFLRQVEELAVE